MDATRPHSPHFNEHYWSGGAAEKTHVFLHGNNLPARMANASAFTVAELGFGTGLNLLLTLHLWRAVAPAHAHLTYISYELHPLTAAELAPIHAALPEGLHPLATALRLAYQPRPGWNTLAFGKATLHLYVGEASAGLATHPEPADAWYLDGFSPATNPQLWTSEILATVARHTVPGGTASTYSVAALVRENLGAAGFTIAKVKGHFPKRHMLTAIKGVPA